MPVLGRPTRQLRQRRTAAVADLHRQRDDAQRTVNDLRQVADSRADDNEVEAVRVQLAQAQRRRRSVAARRVRPPVDGPVRTAAIVLVAVCLWVLSATLWATWQQHGLTVDTDLEARLFSALMLLLPTCGTWLLWQVNTRERQAAHRRWAAMMDAADRAADRASRAVDDLDGGDLDPDRLDAAIAAAELHVQRLDEAIDEAGRTSRAGQSAQERVGQALNHRFGGDGLVAHELSFGFDGDVDHVVVTDRLLLVVEAKAGRGDVAVGTDGTVTTGGRPLRGDPVEQLRRQGDRIARITGTVPALLLVVADGHGQASTLQRPTVHVCGLDDLAAVTRQLRDGGTLPTSVTMTVARQWRQGDRRLLVHRWLDDNDPALPATGQVRQVTDHGTFVDVADGVTVRIPTAGPKVIEGAAVTVTIDDVNRRRGLLAGHLTDDGPGGARTA